MGVTIRINGLTVSHKGSGGYEKNSAPDVCKTPPHPVPVPYTIVSFSSGLVRGTTTVFADSGQSVAIHGSAHTPCTGDQPGSVGGVVSGTIVEESTWITFSPNVKADGKNVCRQSDKMFMNKKNTISGTGGNWEPTLSTNDPVLLELCKVFCRINNDGQPNKDARGKEAARARPEVEDAARRQYGRGAGPVYDKSIMHPTRRRIPGPNGRPRVNWANDLAGLEDKLRRSFFRNATRVLGRQALDKASRLWTRAIPFVGWAMTAYDIYDLGSTAADLWKQYKDTAVDRLRGLAGQGYNIYEARPDVSIDVDGQTKGIYDFKFGNDGWQPGQQELYDDILSQSGGGRAIPVDQNTCECEQRGRAGV